MNHFWQRGRAYGLLGLILFLAAGLRLYGVALVPGWYTDEGTHLEIVRHLLAGRTQYLAVTESTLLVARLPLFEWLLTGWVYLFGLSMGSLRSLTAVLGTLAVVMLYVVVRDGDEKDRLLPFVAAFLLAIYPAAVLYSRLGFSYNLLTLFLLLALWGLQRYQRHLCRRGLMVAAVAVGFGMVSDLWGMTLLPALVLAVVTVRWRDLWWTLALALVPLALYVVVHLRLAPAAFWFDLQFALFRANQMSLAMQWETLRHNLALMLVQDGWMGLGWLGLWRLRSWAWRHLVLLFFLCPLLILGRTVALHGLSAYYLIPLWPLLALGVAVSVRDGVMWLAQWVTPEVVFVGVMGVVMVVGWRGGGRLLAAIDPFLLDGTVAETTAVWLAPRIEEDMLVLASPTLAWLLPGQVADFQMMVAFEAAATPHFPADVPSTRFAFAIAYEQACFVVVDDLWRRWAMVHMPAVAMMMADVTTSWSVVYQVGEVVVYKNSAFC